ncbi:MAG: HD domain-containing protein [Desulfuromonadales bacterium]|nr:HD domain-containing protein [Desulfuromonadales bacterium]NIR32927.1 HD domain-containing protein [Desulfuromonadales bacterium]NIS39174.1 HD domain-containing protein [Desulfuromonadales bacterium]
MSDISHIERIFALPADERDRRLRHDAALRDLLPEVYALRGIQQPPDYHPEGDAFTHTLLAVYHLPEGADRRLAWAALLHDIGKAQTTQRIDGRWRAFGHDRVGETLAERRLEQLGMPAQAREDVCWLIRHHMFALSWQIDDLRQLSRRQKRFIADPRFPLLVDLMSVDAMASGPNRAKLNESAFYRRARAIYGNPPVDC